MPKNISPGNDNFMKHFGNFETLKKSFLKEKLSNSQRQMVIRLIAKKRQRQKINAELETISFAKYRF